MHRFLFAIALAGLVGSSAFATTQGAAPSGSRTLQPGGGAGARALSILVFDTDTRHQFAQAAAINIEPSGTVVAGYLDFDTKLASQSWDVVVVDCPSNVPANGWAGLANHVSQGGSAVVSYWDWDNSLAPGVPSLRSALEIAYVSSFSLVGRTLMDTGASSVFLGVTMPNSDWHDHWNDDGDDLTAVGSAIGIGYLSSPTTPCMVLGNGGRTIAAPVFDEAGDTWLNSGEAVQLWENMIREVLASSLAGDVSQISLASGGQQVLSMDLGPPAALKAYQILGSASGAAPGVVYTGTSVPLNPDAYTIFSLLNPNQPPLLNSAGTLDLLGRATSVFTLPAASDPSLAGITVHHAGITIEVVGSSLVVSLATDAVACTLVP